MIRIKIGTEKEFKDRKALKETRILVLNQNPNNLCVNIVDVVFDKVIEVVSEDKSMSQLQKAIVLGAATRSKEPIKNYVLNLNNSDAQDIINKINNILK